ncbi:hypothetical protein GQ457_10G009770 [Hibiscus cannabinus]
MPKDGTNLLEVPGNRLPETGSSCTEATQISKAQKSLRQNQGSRKKSKSKNLKPKRIKDYLEYTISQRNLNPAKKICQGRTRCLQLRHPLCHPAKADYRSPWIEEVEALTINPEATIV